MTKQITYFFRKPRPQYFSIEKVFNEVINHLPSDVNAKKYVLKNGTSGFFNRLKALYEAYKNKGYINHITGDITFISLALPKKNLIVTFHDLESFIAPKGWKAKLIKYFWITLPARRAQVITAISQDTKNKIVAWTGINPDKIKVIYNPLPKELKYKPKDNISKTPKILLIGTKENKNFEGSIKTISNLNVEVIIVGKLSKEQQNLLKKHNIKYENLVHVPYDDIINAYEKCDILCFPSFFEGFGLPIIEAQAIGRPVITSNLGAMKEIAGDSAILVDPYNHKEISNAISNIINNSKLRNSLIQKGFENIQKFKPENIAKKYSKVLD